MATHIGVLPKEILHALSLPDAPEHLRFFRLQHPRTGLAALFLATTLPSDPAGTIVEVQNVSPATKRSWFMDDNRVIGDGNLLLMTPIDLAFLLVPILEATIPSGGSSGNFRTIDDLFDVSSSKLSSSTSNGETLTDCISPEDVLSLSEFTCVHNAMKLVCETKEAAPGLLVYRFSREQLLNYLSKKVTRISDRSIIEKSKTLTRELAKDGLMDDGKDELLRQGLIRSACDLISQYVSPEIHADLLARYDLSSLQTYMQHLQDESVASKVDAKDDKAGKQSQNADGKKRKAQTSKGVEKLKKVNTTGMAKLSTFFQKPAK